MTFSAEQLAIFDWFKSGTGNLVVRARAGTGKTFTIKESFKHAPEKKILYAVFNKKNQVEAAEKIKDSRVDVKTLHSLGFRFIKSVWSDARPDDNVEYDRLDSLFPNLRYEDRGAILKLVGFAKNLTINPTREDLEQICDERNLEFEKVDGVACASEHLALSKEQDPQNRISFNDMVWLPVAQGWVNPIYDLVVIDEAQDQSLPQLVMARGACKPDGRVVVVGDDRQCIYSFRGAKHNGMDTMRCTLRAAILTLTTTYRCPKAVVALARGIVGDYQSHESMHDGEVINIGNTDTAKPGDAILSRLNAPLMPIALNLIRKNIPARIEGRDIGKQLIAMVKTLKANSVPQFLTKLQSWLDKQTERLTKVKGHEKKIEQSRDIADTLIALATDCKGVGEIESRISNLFSDTDSNSIPSVVLSSVHKAKGLEWKRVFILTETFRKGKSIEEDNIWYVAVTRSQHSLFLVGQAEEKEEKEEMHEAFA